VCSNNKTQRARWRECGQISLLELSTRYFASKSKRKHVTPFLSDIKKKRNLSLLLNRQDATLLRARSSLVSLLIELSEKEQTKNVALIAK
jgi:hypothetical protein|tara:strand:+ start:3543 stop:3812 length:270 start_codon:yes stop_codon:yes gene_type:complete